MTWRTASRLIHINAAADLPHYPALVKKENVMWWDWSYWPMPHFFFGPLFMIAIFAICMIMMMWMMGHRRGGGSSTLDILNDRYARGEINQAEYEERRRVLRL
jgi:putative membrane protein